MTRRKKSPLSKTRRDLEARYKATYDDLPHSCRCALCGKVAPKEAMERHHPARRRKHAFLFTVQLCGQPCHHWVEHHGKQAEELGLLWKGRNSKNCNVDVVRELVHLMPFPPLYSIDIYTKYSP